MKIIPKPEIYESEDIVQFATDMDMDMNTYFVEKESVVEKDDAHRGYKSAFINPNLFTFFIQEEYFESYDDDDDDENENDEEDEWQICCELKQIPGAGCIVIERFSMSNTTREEVVKEMERIIIEGRL